MSSAYDMNYKVDANAVGTPPRIKPNVIADESEDASCLTWYWVMSDWEEKIVLSKNYPDVKKMLDVNQYIKNALKNPLLGLCIE